MKRFLVLLGMLAVGNAFGYTHTLYNNSNSRVLVKIDLIGAIDKNVELAPRSEQSVSVLGWCARGVEARGLDGEAAGLTGIAALGTRCRNMRVDIDFIPGTEKIDPQSGRLIRTQGELQVNKR